MASIQFTAMSPWARWLAYPLAAPGLIAMFACVLFIIVLFIPVVLVVALDGGKGFGK